MQSTTRPAPDHPTTPVDRSAPDHTPDHRSGQPTTQVDHPTTGRPDRALRRLELADRKRAAKRAARADREADRTARRERRRADRAAKWSARADRAQALGETLRPVVPLLMVNTAAVYGQWDYLYQEGVEYDWNQPSRIAIATIGAIAAETVSLYVGWHAHDALIHKAHRTARNLRRWSYAIASVFAAINYSHFAEGATNPTAIAVLLGAFTLLSPWLWGLHTRRAQHLQLLAEGAPVDAGGATFAPERVRAFPIRSWQARRWSIDYNITDPITAWEGYRAHRDARRADRSTGRVRAAWSVLRGRSTTRPAPDHPTTRPPATEPTTRPVPAYEPAGGQAPDRPTTTPATDPTTQVDHPTTAPAPDRHPTKRTRPAADHPTGLHLVHGPTAVADAAMLRAQYGDDPPGRNELMRRHGGNAGRWSNALKAHRDGADRRTA